MTIKRPGPAGLQALHQQLPMRDGYCFAEPKALAEVGCKAIPTDGGGRLHESDRAANHADRPSEVVQPGVAHSLTHDCYTVQV